MQFILAFSIIALAGRALAQFQQSLPSMPPGCLLHAVNTQPEPSDMSSVCGSNAQQVQEAIASSCSESNASVAQAMFIANCGGAGIQVAAYTASTTSSANPSSTTLAVVTTTDASGHTVTRTGSSPTNTGAAASHKGMGPYLAAIVAVAGAFAAL